MAPGGRTQYSDLDERRAQRRTYDVSLRTIGTIATIVSALVAFLTFSLGRASAVSDMREQYVSIEQYRSDQAQVIQALAAIDRKLTALMFADRQVGGDSLIAEPDP